MPRPYALQVTSNPTKVSETLWTQWYTKEHIRDLVYSSVSKTSAVYRASSETIASSQEASNATANHTTFLALYQSTAPHVLEACAASDLKCKVRIHSELFGDGRTCYDVGMFRPRDLQLVEILGSYEHREDVAPYVLHHRISGEEIENKIQFDHVNAVAKLAGYRRTLLYRPIKSDGPGGGGGDGGEIYVILVHEFDEAIDGHELPAVKRDLEVIEPTKGCQFALRAYQLIESEGFGGNCRMPERMEAP